MSEPIPESIPTSHDSRSKRPLKRRALTPVSEQAVTVQKLFAHPEKEIHIPASSTSSSLTASNYSAPPEIVANVQGSSAGAGSGEFHVYKASRRREYERLRGMEEEVMREKDQEVFEKERDERVKRDEEKTRRNREKREKMKRRKGGKKVGEEKGVEGDKTGSKILPRAAGAADGTGGEGEEGNAVETVQEVGLIIHDDD